jgi:hypothetical protein
MFTAVLVILFLLICAMALAAMQGKVSLALQILALFIAACVVTTYMLLQPYAQANNNSSNSNNNKTREPFMVSMSPTFQQQGAEDITSVSKGLTVYASVFSNKSYQALAGDRIWYNIAPKVYDTAAATALTSSDSANTCPAGSGSQLSRESTHFVFDAPVYLDNTARHQGFFINKNRITGPKSYALGINGDTSYTVFFVMKFEGFTEDVRDFVLFKLFANVVSTNGLSMYIAHEDLPIKGDGSFWNVSLRVKHGNQEPYLCGDNGSVTLDTTTPYLFTLVKNYNRLTVRMFRLGNIMSGSETLSQTLLQTASINTNDSILLSNKEMIINESANLHAHLHAFGFYNRALPETDINALRDHFNTEFMKYSEAAVTESRQVVQLQSEIEQIKSCPYDSLVCNSACANITDWSKPSYLLHAQSNCLTAIHDYCQTNPGHSECSCWNPQGPFYNTNVCVNMRNMYQQSQCVNLNTLTESQIEDVKIKYGLTTGKEACPTLPPLPDIKLEDYLISCPKSEGGGEGGGSGNAAAPSAAPSAALAAAPSAPGGAAGSGSASPATTSPTTTAAATAVAAAAPPDYAKLIKPTWNDIQNPFAESETQGGKGKQAKGFFNWLFDMA